MNIIIPVMFGRIQSQARRRYRRGCIGLRSGAPLVIGDHIEDPAIYVHCRYVREHCHGRVRGRRKFKMFDQDASKLMLKGIVSSCVQEQE